MIFFFWFQNDTYTKKQRSLMVKALWGQKTALEPWLPY